jgi:hypothetical protein
MLFYGATYGNLKSKNDFIEEDYPKYLFTANFIAGKYGPIEIDVYKNKNYTNTTISNLILRYSLKMNLMINWLT